MGRDIVAKLANVLPNTIIAGMPLAQKKELFEDLQENVLPDALWAAFLLPNDEEILRQYSAKIDDAFGKGTAKQKRDAIALLRDPELWQEAKGITNPTDKRAPLVTLALIEVLFALRQQTLDAEFVRPLRDVWVSIADHFGLWKIRYALEDTMFLLLEPHEAELVSSIISKKTREHAKLFADIEGIVSHYFEKNGLRDYTILCRKKNLYGVYQKMKFKNKNINHINDLFGIRIITKKKSDCLKAQEILHYIWPAHRHLHKDYISDPKENGYQSLHTTVHCLDGEPVEFQIRTKKMDEVAKFGPASHKLYKQKMRDNT